MEFPLPEDNIGGDDSAANATRASGSKRSFGDLGDDEGDNSGSKKGGTKVDKADPGVATAMREIFKSTAMISSLRESLQTSQDDLASCQNELESAKTEIQKWKSAFEKESFIPARKSPEPSFVVDYIQFLRSSETSLKEQLEIAQMKLAIRDLKSQLKPASMKTDGDPEVDSEQQGSTGPSRNVAKIEEVEVDKEPALLEELRAANAVIAHLEEFQAVELATLKESIAKLDKKIEYNSNFAMLVLQKFPGLFPPPPATENANE
ncbi:FKBP12-interacting protein of 37 kDa isoform X2 [Eutrema salsugineum]|uniref:FKBP12-interacting protein of 37 kDa isoform X2 n=1 Tax=Eutrema salsugineum TaxID=72664 RepID=UPI000CED26EF|nr:FKBP12-interacting protein of 37 kDa isoform X2 [Eutrema salsugineum]